MEKISVTAVTIQAALFSLISTALAQCISAWKQPDFVFTTRPFITFALTALILTPPNYLYQEWLEKTFATLVPGQLSRDRKQLPYLRRSKSNVLIKFGLDQTLGAATNTIVFIALSSFFKYNSLQAIHIDVHEHFLELLMAGWRVWPFVSLANFAVVPWEWRPIVGNTAGLCWGVYLTLMNL